ncbi:MAG: polysaccharide biosynthesis tyrosine autokinase [Thermodesulfobacteriota bacterium]
MSKFKKALDKAKLAREEISGPALNDQLAGAPSQSAPEEAPALVITAKADAAALEARSLKVEAEPLIKKEPREEAPLEFLKKKPVTRLIECEPLVLRRNKVISICHENKTADQIKILRAQVLEKLKDLTGNSLLITSPNPGAGKTFTSINLAISVAQEINRTTLLVDADLRKPSIHKYFGFQVEKGLAEYLLGQAEMADLLVNPGIPKLTILPGGAPIINSSELLGAPRMETLVKEMKNRYSDRLLIFDTSSLLTSADPLVFSRFIDGVLLVVEAERTSNKQLKRAMELLRERPVIGAVYNKVRAQYV